MRGKDAPLEKDTNLERKTTDELIALLSHPNKWHRHTAVRLLGERKDPRAKEKLKRRIADENGLGALTALWALHQSAGLDPAAAFLGLKHASAPVRMWTVRLLGDEWGLHRNLGSGRHSHANGKMPTNVFDVLLAQAETETDLEVLSQFASTARRLDSSQAMRLVSIVLGHDRATQDPYIPLLCWWVFEAHIPAANNDVLALFKSSALWGKPMVFEHILSRLARRYAVDDKRAHLLLCAEFFRFAPSQQHAVQLMKGFEEAFRGRAMTGLPDELIAAITKSDQAPLVFRLKQGDPDAVAEAIKRIQDEKADDRLALVRAFGAISEPKAVPALLAIVSSPAPHALRKAALASLSSYDDEGIGVKTVELLPRLTGDVQTAAFTLFASRAAWSARLLEAVESGKVKAAAIPEDIVDRLRSKSERAARLLPKAERATSRSRIDEITAILKRAPGNPYAGETAYQARCGACHKLFFKGGNVGPDLTAYQRDNLSTTLLSIIDPNAEIREGFQYYTVETKDGRTLSGFFVDRDNQVTVLRGLDGENITLRASEILDLQPMGRSLMPEGLLEGMTDQELRDLFAYLRISQPITN